jgi:tetratricopeptide (TPR) repeat protein
MSLAEIIKKTRNLALMIALRSRGLCLHALCVEPWTRKLNMPASGASTNAFDKNTGRHDRKATPGALEKRRKHAKRENEGPNEGASEELAGRPGGAGRPRLLGGWGAGLALALLTCAAYAPVTRAGFIWDDEALTDYPALGMPGGLGMIWRGPAGNPHESHYWPLTYTTFWVERRLWGAGPLGYHLDNALLHAANALLLWGLLRRLKLRGAWLGAALFGVHPIHVESVAWAIERKDVLSGFFYLGSLLAWMEWLDRRKRWGLAMALALLAAAMLSKSTATSLPATMAVLAWWRVGRARAGDAWALAGAAALTAGFTAYDLHVVHIIEPPLNLGPFSLWDRLAMAGRNFWIYAWHCLWPARLAAVYPEAIFRATRPMAWAGPAAGASLLAALVATRRRLGRGPLACFLIYGATLAPASGLVAFGFMRYSTIADRFAYLPSMALLAGVAELAALGLGRLAGGRRWPAWVAGAALLAPLTGLCWRQACYHQSSEALFRRNVALYPSSWGARFQLGLTFYRQGKLDMARREFEASTELSPSFPQAHVYMGMVLADLRQWDGALVETNKGLALLPGNHIALNNRGRICLMTGRLAEAEADFAQVLLLFPNDGDALFGLGCVRLNQGRFDEAQELLRRASERSPQDANLHASLAEALERKGDVAGAIAQYQEALRRNPGIAKAAARLAALSKEKR